MMIEGDKYIMGIHLLYQLSISHLQNLLPQSHVFQAAQDSSRGAFIRTGTTRAKLREWVKVSALSIKLTGTSAALVA